MKDPPERASGGLPAKETTAHTRGRYDMIAPLYDLMEWPVERWLYRSWRRELWSKIEGPEVLEIGVGTGKNIPFYPNDVRVTAIDLSPGMLKRARRVARSHPDKTVTLREMDAQALDLPDDTFDDVVATFVFCSVPDPVQGLREAQRVVRPGGRLHLLEHMRATTPWLAPLMDALDTPFHWLTGVHIARETVQNVQKAGWTLDDVTALSRADVFRRIEAHKPDRPPDDPQPIESAITNPHFKQTMPDTTQNYYYTKTIDLSPDEAEARVREELEEEDFGVLTEIDVQATLKKKLDEDMRPYKILGACNPPYAHKALEAEDKIGTMLPCNVIVQQSDDGRTEVAAVDPVASMQAVNNEALRPIAEEIRDRLRRVIDRV